MRKLIVRLLQRWSQHAHLPVVTVPRVGRWPITVSREPGSSCTCWSDAELVPCMAAFIERKPKGVQTG